MSPRKAFVLAAGLGTRLRPYTADSPKPLLEIAGRSLLDRTLDHLEAAGVSDVTLNLHYMADRVKDHLQSRSSPALHFSVEDKVLGTGGGIKRALSHFGDGPFYVLSGDGLWCDGPEKPALQRMAEAWDPEEMDILLLLQPVDTMVLTGSAGDYDLTADGRIARSRNQKGAYMFTSIRINAPGVFDNTPEGEFSYLDLMDRAETQGRLFGLVHDGDWHHISTPQDLEAVNAIFSVKK